MSEVRNSGVNIIEGMPRNEFHQKYIRGICKARSFGALFSFGSENLSPEEKLEVREFLSDNDISFSMTETDDDLDQIAEAVSKRAVSLR